MSEVNKELVINTLTDQIQKNNNEKEEELKAKNIRMSRKYFVTLADFYGYQGVKLFQKSKKGQEILQSFQDILNSDFEENRKALKLSCAFSKYRDKALK